MVRGLASCGWSLEAPGGSGATGETPSTELATSTPTGQGNGPGGEQTTAVPVAAISGRHPLHPSTGGDAVQLGPASFVLLRADKQLL